MRAEVTVPGSPEILALVTEIRTLRERAAEIEDRLDTARHDLYSWLSAHGADGVSDPDGTVLAVARMSPGRPGSLSVARIAALTGVPADLIDACRGPSGAPFVTVRLA